MSFEIKMQILEVKDIWIRFAYKITISILSVLDMIWCNNNLKR